MELFHKLGLVCLVAEVHLTVKWCLHMPGFSEVVSEFHKLGCCQGSYRGH